MIRRPPRSTRVRSSAASDVYKRQVPLKPEHDRNHWSNSWQTELHLTLNPRWVTLPDFSLTGLGLILVWCTTNVRAKLWLHPRQIRRHHSSRRIPSSTPPPSRDQPRRPIPHKARDVFSGWHWQLWGSSSATSAHRRCTRFRPSSPWSTTPSPRIPAASSVSSP